MMRKNILLIMLLSAVIFTVSCRKNDTTPAATTQYVTSGDNQAPYSKLYVLNEGNMNENRATLDYLDFQTGGYTKNIYPSVNPTIVKALGDVGNDLQIYGGKIYAVINMSNKVEVMDAATGKHLGQIDLKNCRNITFALGKAYVSAYNRDIVSSITGDDNPALGIVAEIDTASFKITRSVLVGRQPEGVCIVNNKLYVANSGGYSPLNYERTVSVIDLNSFSVIKTIDVAINLKYIEADNYGNLYVSSLGDYGNIRSKLFIINTQNDAVTDSLDIATSNFAIYKDTAYVIGTPWNNNSGTTSHIQYLKVDIKQLKILSNSFITDGSDKSIAMPYGILVNPYSGDIYLSDALDYQAAGYVYCFGNNGTLKWKANAGQIPAHFTLLKK